MFLPVLTGARCLQHRASILTFFAISRQLIWTNIRCFGREKLITDLFLSHTAGRHDGRARRRRRDDDERGSARRERCGAARGTVVGRGATVARVRRERAGATGLVSGFALGCVMYVRPYGTR